MERGDENEFERKLRLEKVVASKKLRLVVVTEEERRVRLENDAATKRLRLARLRKKSKTGEDDSYHTAQVGPGDRGRKKSKKGMDLMDLIWIEIGVFKNKISRNELDCPPFF